MINLASQTRAGSSSESGCPLRYTHRGKLPDIRTREPSPPERIPSFPKGSECVVFTQPNYPPGRVLPERTVFSQDATAVMMTF